MGTLFEDTQAVLILADYANTDASGKLNMLGAGFSLAGWDPNGQTAPMHIAVLIDVHGRHRGKQFSFVLELRDRDADEVVSVPGALGQPEALRISQLATVERANLPGVHLPDELPCRVQMMLGFPTGLPLSPGRQYGWRLEVDGKTRKNWWANFYVPLPPPGPVFGGPAGPADIPGVERPLEVDDEDDA